MTFSNLTIKCRSRIHYHYLCKSTISVCRRFANILKTLRSLQCALQLFSKSRPVQQINKRFMAKRQAKSHSQFVARLISLLPFRMRRWPPLFVLRAPDLLLRTKRSRICSLSQAVQLQQRKRIMAAQVQWTSKPPNSPESTHDTLPLPFQVPRILRIVSV